MALLDDFVNLINALEDSDIKYATCGGLAMAVHGYVRATKDIDIMIDESDLDKSFQIARSQGYDIEGLPLNFKDENMKIRRISKVDQASKALITIDFILVTDAMEDVWSDRQLVEWPSGEAWVVSKAGLKKMKKLAGRDIDLLDIKRLEEDEDED